MIATRRRQPSPRGMTLLEVLISCGVLVLGLASIASLLPAAGSRLAQATTEDRAGTLAANARTDALARGLLAFDLFNEPGKSIGFGRGLYLVAPEPYDDTIPPPPGKPNEKYDQGEPYLDLNNDSEWSSGMMPSHFGGMKRLAYSRIDFQRGFLLEDDVVYAAPTTAQTPSNEFENGRRSFKEGLCWGATLVPQEFPAKAGTAAVLSVAVFRKFDTESRVEAVELTAMTGGLYRMKTLDEGKLKKLLKSCSYVLVPSADPSKGPRWFRITASWTASGNGFVVFADPEFPNFAGPNPPVIGFENLIRVDQSNVILE